MTDLRKFAHTDLDRAKRRGFPEVIFGEGKSTEQILAIARELHDAKQTVLITRLGAAGMRAVEETFPQALLNPVARTAVIHKKGRRPKPKAGILFVCAGTTDLPALEEAIVTAEAMGQKTERLVDVGVAGLHRLTTALPSLRRAKVIVVAAGMDGVLPTVVSGLVSSPVIGLPTSVGYGTGQGGQAALNTMLNACSPGITVVNIDNGFGAGYAATLINNR